MEMRTYFEENRSAIKIFPTNTNSHQAQDKAFLTLLMEHGVTIEKRSDSDRSIVLVIRSKTEEEATIDQALASL